VADKCQPLAEWVRGGNEVECRSCSLAFVTAWYRDLLKQNGLAHEAQAIERVAESDDPVQVARALDGVKDRVPLELQQKLRGYDCAVQEVKEDLP